MTALAEPQLSVDEVLEKARGGERISDEDAVALLRSRDLVAVGRVADEIRNRLTDPSRVTFIVDRNLNYTNVCVTDCDFCAFYRRPGDTREGYLLPKAVIFKKIEETLSLGGTALLMQGGHHPDLAIDFYEDLFRSIKERYTIHLHALSPPEIQHIARRSKLTVPASGSSRGARTSGNCCSLRVAASRSSHGASGIALPTANAAVLLRLSSATTTDARPESPTLPVTCHGWTSPRRVATQFVRFSEGESSVSRV